MTSKPVFPATALTLSGLALTQPQDIELGMLDERRAFAVTVFQDAPEVVEVNYKGWRNNGARAVNISTHSGCRTFQSSLRRAGCRIKRFIVKSPSAGAGNGQQDCRYRAAIPGIGAWPLTSFSI